MTINLADLRIKRKREGGREGGWGWEKNGRGRLGRREGKGRLTTKAHILNSMFLYSRSGCKMLIGRDMSRAAVSYSLVVRLPSLLLSLFLPFFSHPFPPPPPFPFALARQATLNPKSFPHQGNVYSFNTYLLFCLLALYYQLLSQCILKAKTSLEQRGDNSTFHAHKYYMTRS